MGAEMESGAATDGTSEETGILSETDRQRVLSALGIKLKFSLFVFLVLIGLGGAMMAMVSEIFDQLTPSTRNDLQWKTQRGALELAKRMELAIVLEDQQMLLAEAADYVGDNDVVGILVESASGKRIFAHGEHQRWDELRAKDPAVVNDFDLLYGAWATSSIESAEVGRVGLFVSKERLFAGERLQGQMTVATFLGALLALALCLLFVNLYVGPILKVTADAFVSLEATTEAALEAARLKSQFLANMSHEIRTPMNGVLGMLAVLQRTKLSSDQRRYSTTIETSAKGLLHIIDEVLDFSKLDAGKMALRAVDFDLSEMLSEVSELLAVKAHEKKLELVVSRALDVPQRLHADSDRLRQVILNLLGNALKFTEVGHVALRIERVEQDGPGLMLRFSVSDSGVGIAEDDLATLFESFSQVDGTLTRAQGGTGLGLAISAQLVDMMGGEFTVTSRVGEGSCFSFTCYVERCENCAPDEVFAERNARIVVVSLAAPQRDHIQRLTTAWGMRVDSVASCSAGLELLSDILDEDGVVDAVVLDLPVGKTDPQESTLLDVCTGEDIPVMILASAARMTTEMTIGCRQVALHKPMRVSEIYNGLLGLMDGTIERVDSERVLASNSSSSEPAVRESRPAADGPLVLVVDDNAINREVAEELLADLGYRTETACDGLEAVNQAASGRFSAILMDCQMPVMDGHQATQRIRAMEGDVSKIPIIALTAHALSGDRDKVLTAGMDDYASKPVQSRVLHKLLRHWIPDTARAKPTTTASTGEVIGATGAAKPLRLLNPDMRRSPKVIGMFRDSAPGLADEMSAQAEAEDVSALKATAHKLKGGCLTLGAEVCAALCQFVETEASAGRVAVDSVAEVRQSVVDALNAMQQPSPKPGGNHVDG